MGPKSKAGSAYDVRRLGKAGDGREHTVTRKLRNGCSPHDLESVLPKLPIGRQEHAPGAKLLAEVGQQIGSFGTMLGQTWPKSTNIGRFGL